MEIAPPVDDDDVPRYWRELGLPGLVDVHVHFLPDRVQAKVWQFFERRRASTTAPPWPLRYARPGRGAAGRPRPARRAGVPDAALPAPAGHGGLAQRLVGGVRATADPRVLQSATFYPEPEAPFYVAEALRRGARVFKVHVQVGGFDPRDPLLDAVWARLAETGTPIVIHCGSGPRWGEHTGRSRSPSCCERYPRLQLVIAHLGMPEYRDFLDLAERYERVHLDTTMFATDFTEALMPFDPRRPAPAGGAAATRCCSAATSRRSPTPTPTSSRRCTGSIWGRTWLRAVLWQNGARLFGIERVTPSFRLTAAVLGTPDPPGLARFYQRLLGWPIRDDEPDWVTLRPADGGTGLSFQLETDHVPPVWPAGRRRPSRCSCTSTSQVDDLAAAAAIALAAGATLAEFQPQDDVRVLLDPAGHPFCLWVRS